MKIRIIKSDNISFFSKPYILPRVIIFIFMAISATTCYAAGCSMSTSTSSIALPNLLFNRDIPINTQIGNVTSSTSGVQFTCDKTTTGPIDFGFKVSSASLLGTINGRSIFNTNINGIGLAVGMQITSPSSCASTIFWADGTNLGAGYIGNRLGCTIQGGSATSFSGLFYIALYKTSALVSSGTVDLSQRIRGILRVNGTWLPDINSPGEYILQTNSFTISSATCTVKYPGAISLPPISSTALPLANSVAGQIPFSLSLACPTQTSVAITFTDNNNIAQTGSILTPSSNSSTKGVGMQLRYLGSIVNFGPDSSIAGNTNQIALAPITGTQSFPFTVSYIRTGAITPGTLTTQATFTLSYQ